MGKLNSIVIVLILSFASMVKASGIAPALKELHAIRVETVIKLDGILDEPIWHEAPMAVDFTQHNPNPGVASSQRTEVQVVYDNVAIYVGVTLFDVANDSILRQLSDRDDEDNTDVFGFFVDTYNDDQNAYGFVVHPTGVQWDARYSAVGQDVSWDAVWKSAVSIDDKNWYVEMKIPYSAIRFPDNEEQIWGVNFARKIRRKREFSFWSTTLPSVDGLVRQFGQLTGIKNIESPVRLAFIPYVSGFGSNYSDPANGISSNSTNFRGGMDIKYGINDAFTLDLTLIPDFGQVQSDNQVLNLSQFEVFFQERRPFFMEGTELFNKSGLFYSRRIGGKPLNYSSTFYGLAEGDEIMDNPTEVQLFNSTKVTGRTNDKLGIGILNSVTGQTEAEIKRADGETVKIPTAPTTNYNIFVLDQTLKNNSYITFTNTNVMREGSVYDANVSGIDIEIRDKQNIYAIGASGATSQLFLNQEKIIGHKLELEFNKISGNVQFEVEYKQNSDQYNQNDLGFQTYGNFEEFGGEFSYQTFKPFGIFNKTENNIRSKLARSFSGRNYMNFNVRTNHTMTLRSWHSMGVWTNVEPINGHDYYETRDFSQYYLMPENFNFGGWVSSDYRKVFALDARLNYRKYNEAGRYRFNFGLSPRFRVNDHLFFTFNFNSYNFPNNIGWAKTLPDEIVFSKRDEHTIENSLRGKYIFTNRMGLTFRVRHYWSTARYNEFYKVDTDGKLVETTYIGFDADGNSLHNVNFNAFNVDIIYSWVFAPGSQLSITYKNAILSAQDNITRDYFNNFNRMIGEAQTNSLNIKLLYYLDYLSLKKRG